jgi:hypothetical protein
MWKARSEVEWKWVTDMSGVLLYTSTLDSSCELSRIRYCGYCGGISKQASSSYDDVIVHVCSAAIL